LTGKNFPTSLPSMALLGKGLLGIWHDLAIQNDAELQDFQLWYTKQHLPERLNIAGFLRGRRYQAVEGDPQFAALYETETAETLASPAYHKQLNNPTEWSTVNLAKFRNTNRTAFKVKESFGYGIGAGLSVAWISPSDKTKNEMENWVRKAVFGKIMDCTGVVGIHMCEGNQEATHAVTKELEIRGTPDKMSEWIVLVEGHNSIITKEVLSKHLSAETSMRKGADSYDSCHYQLIHSSISDDISDF